MAVLQGKGQLDELMNFSLSSNLCMLYKICFKYKYCCKDMYDVSIKRQPGLCN